MAIKMILCILVLSTPLFAAQINTELEKKWKLFLEQEQRILNSQNLDNQTLTTVDAMRSNEKILTNAEYHDIDAERKMENVEAHLKKIKESVYVPQGKIFLDYLNWQRELGIETPSSKKNLVVTNSALCLGGSYANSNSHFTGFIDGCLFAGKSNVGSESNTVVYKQDNISTFGIKLAPGFGFFVNSKLTEIGFKIPVIAVNQHFTEPKQAGFSLKDDSKVSAMASVYMRFPFERAFFQMEFGKFLDQDTTLWAAGVGLRL